MCLECVKNSQNSTVKRQFNIKWTEDMRHFTGEDTRLRNKHRKDVQRYYPSGNASLNHKTRYTSIRMAKINNTKC